MGHANKSTTLSIYTHLFQDDADFGRDVANTFDDVMKNSAKSHEKVTILKIKRLQPLQLQSVSGGSAWESNPPEKVSAPHIGFEDRKAHQHLSTPKLHTLSLYHQS